MYSDDSGPEMMRMLTLLTTSANWPLEPVVVESCIVPDDPSKCTGQTDRKIDIHIDRLID